MKHILVCVACGCLFVGKTVAEEPAADHPLAHYYGFLSPEIYKLDFRIANLLIRDVRGDGKPAVVVVNNANNRIDFLEQRTGEKPETNDDLEVNEIPDDKRLALRKISVPRQVQSLEVKDVNGDGKPDLVYIGDPSGLYVDAQKEDGSFHNVRHYDISDLQTAAWSLDVADLNGDGRNDIAALGKQDLYIFYQDDNGRLKEPTKFRLSEAKASLLRLLDFNSDGATDIVFLSDDQEFPVRARFQDQQGGLGPERRFAIDPPRGVTYADVDGKPGQELLMISNLSGRMLVYAFDNNGKSNDNNYQLVTYPFEKSGSAAQTDIAVTDMDGDGFLDAAVCDSESARLLLYRQEGNGNLGLGASYPGMLGASLLRGLDVDGDGKSELLSLSSSEKAIGMCRYDGSRLTFPESLPSRDEPVAMEVIPGEETTLVYLARVPDTERRQDKYFLRKLTYTKDKGSWAEAKFGETQETEVTLKSKPLNMRAVDVNLDGHPDLMFFFLFQPPALMLADGNGGFASIPDYTQSSLGAISSAAVFSGTLLDKEPALLVAQSNFARNLQLEQNSRWRVKDQYNATETSANVTGVTVLDVDGDGGKEVAMYDRSSSSIVLLKQTDGLYRRSRTIKVGAFDLRGMQTADLDKDGHDDLLLFDTDKMSVIYNGKQDAQLKEIASYETDLRNGKLFDVAAGDLNGDSKPDLLLLEPVAHNLEIVQVGEDNKLRRAQRWEVFEEKTFSRSLGGGMEPREMVIGDVNADGLPDIVVLAHNRVLIYLQDDGNSEKPATPETTATTKSSTPTPAR